MIHRVLIRYVYPKDSWASPAPASIDYCIRTSLQATKHGMQNDGACGMMWSMRVSRACRWSVWKKDRAAHHNTPHQRNKYSCKLKMVVNLPRIHYPNKPTSLLIYFSSPGPKAHERTMTQNIISYHIIYENSQNTGTAVIWMY